jgi:hypothetical protein
MDTFGCGAAKSSWLSGFFWAVGGNVSFRQKAIWLGSGKRFVESEETEAAFQATMAVLLCGFIAAGFSRSGFVPAEQSYSAELSDATRIALAGGRTLALDSYA